MSKQRIAQLADVIIQGWPEYFRVMPDRRHRVNAILAYRTFMQELGQRFKENPRTHLSETDHQRWFGLMMRHYQAVESARLLRRRQAWRLQ